MALLLAEHGFLTNLNYNTSLLKMQIKCAGTVCGTNFSLLFEVKNLA